jgi:4-hydroxy-3-methylbut-2-enyl diphosphate reductase
MGVKRAVQIVHKELEKQSVYPIYTYGPLIHNQQVIDELSQKGVKILDEHEIPDVLDRTIVVIRAHGIPPAIETELKARGAIIVDATCPRVRNSQKRAKALQEQGYTLFLAGDASHAEITGILGYAPKAIIVSSVQEARGKSLLLKQERGSVPVAVLAQTTLAVEEFQEIVEVLTKEFPNVVVESTICKATQERQDALKELCNKVDAVVVVGGANSANTCHLFELAQQSGKPAWHIEGPENIPPEVFSYPVVGLTAGASTPDSIVDKVEQVLCME